MSTSLKKVYGFNYHGARKSVYLTATKTNKYNSIEIQLKILQVLLQMQLSSDNIDFIYYGSNQVFVDMLKPLYPKLQAGHVITYLQRLAKAGFLTISYNPDMHEVGKPNYYAYKTENEEIRPNVFIDYTINHYREIKLDMDYIAKLASVIDPETDPIYLELPRGCVARRFIKKRCMTSNTKVKERYKEISTAMSKKLLKLKIKFKNYKDAIKYFILNTTNKFYEALKLIKNHIFAKIETEQDKQNKFASRVGTIAIDPATGEVHTVPPAEPAEFEPTEEQTLLMDDFYRNII